VQSIFLEKRLFWFHKKKLLKLTQSVEGIDQNWVIGLHCGVLPKKTRAAFIQLQLQQQTTIIRAMIWWLFGRYDERFSARFVA